MKNAEFYYNIGDIIQDNHRHLVIKNKEKRMTNRKDNKNYRAKMYELSCKNCGWEDFWMEECELKRGRGCSCCSGRTVVANINSVAHTNPWIIDYFIGGYEEASKYTKHSEKRIIFQCPFCKEYSQPYLIGNIIKNHGFSCLCRSTTSFPERILKQLLNKLNIPYVYQLTCKHFDWVGKFRYDFYLPNQNAIIETHGIQHYKDSNLFCNLIEEQENDKLKMELAKENSIRNYFIINCSESSIDYIKKSILDDNILCNLLNIKEEIFDELQPYDFSEYENICNLWNTTQDSISSISNKLNISWERVKNILILSAKNGDTNFSESLKNKRKTISNSQKSKPIRCVNNNIIFKNVYLCESLSNKIFGVNLSKNSIIYNILNNRRYKGFLFEYISKEEFNKAKQESPELCFGDSFVL